MKLNTGKAWEEASRMIGSNRELVIVLAGIFFFIPLFVLFLAALGTDWNFGSDQDPEMVERQIQLFMQQYWWAILLVAIGQLCGSISLLGLLGDRKKPTVGDVIKSIPKLILPVIAAQILAAIIVQVLPLLAGLLPETTASVLNLILFPVTIYLTVKFTLAAAVIVIDEKRNPIEALRGSWRLTKGNSFRIFVFFFMLTFATLVLGLITFIIVGLILALTGDRVQLIGSAALLSVIFGAFYAVTTAVTAAIHRELSRGDNGDPAIASE